MLLAGDELGRTQGGNNNAYCQDNELSWMHWPADPSVATDRFVLPTRWERGRPWTPSFAR